VYVFGIASFSFEVANDGSVGTSGTTQSNQMARPGGVDSSNVNYDGAARRLRSINSGNTVEKTLIVNAVQNVYAK
jgi:hypothetical protein